MDQPGTLYVVATPIGNLDDISKRAVAVLGEVDCIAAEDTRHSGQLLRKLGISTPLRSYHDFSSPKAAQELLALLESGQCVALISDAGTPLLADPGFKLVRSARQAGIEVVPVPGASALLAALSVAGIASDRFVFEGFLPRRAGARLGRIRELAQETRSLVCFESSHRIIPCLEDLVAVLGAERELFIGRELTKKFETHLLGSLADCLAQLESIPEQRKGEFVLVIAGCPESQLEQQKQQSALAVVDMLAGEVSLRQAVAIAARLTGARKNQLYDTVLKASRDGS